MCRDAAMILIGLQLALELVVTIPFSIILSKITFEMTHTKQSIFKHNVSFPIIMHFILNTLYIYFKGATG